jgi:glyoxylase-like metal-dependent hydrolase (beta-lactamase superfamily II)
MNILNIGYMSTNYYLLDNGRTTLLVDAGWPGTLGKFRQVLHAKKVDIGSIHYFFVTHFHPDHAGLVQELKDLGVKFILLKEQEYAIPLMRCYIKPDANYANIRSEGAILLPIAGSRAFLQGLGFAGEFVLTPGHSDDSVTLVLDGGEAFTGDLPLRMPDEDNLPFCQSRQKLRDMGVNRIYPSHGPEAIPFP